MGNIVPIRPSAGEPHVSGAARCSECRHEWVAVAPAGTDRLECPSCHAIKGVFTGDAGSGWTWHCDCGCNLFLITPERTVCFRCGKGQIVS